MLQKNPHILQKSPHTHIIAQQSKVEKTYKQTIEQPHTKNFRSQNNHLFSPRRAARLDPTTVPFHTHPTSNVTLRSHHFLISLLTWKHNILIIHQAWIRTTLSQIQFFSQFHNLTTLILKPSMNLQTPNIAYPLFPSLPFNPSIPKSPINLPQPLPSTLMQPQSTPQ